MKTSLVLALISLALSAGLTGCGKQENAPAPASEPSAVGTPSPAATPAPTPAPAAEPAAPAPTAAANPVGASVYAKTCALCHAAGVGGAPKPGDKADWGPRIAQGEEVLFKHAIEGFTGAKGMMPAKGGGASLSDEEVKAAVTHMVSLSR